MIVVDLHITGGFRRLGVRSGDEVKMGKRKAASIDESKKLDVHQKGQVPHLRKSNRLQGSTVKEKGVEGKESVTERVMRMLRRNQEKEVRNAIPNPPLSTDNNDNLNVPASDSSKKDAGSSTIGNVSVAVPGSTIPDTSKKDAVSSTTDNDKVPAASKKAPAASKKAPGSSTIDNNNVPDASKKAPAASKKAPAASKKATAPSKKATAPSKKAAAASKKVAAASKKDDSSKKKDAGSSNIVDKGGVGVPGSSITATSKKDAGSSTTVNDNAVPQPGSANPATSKKTAGSSGTVNDNAVPQPGSANPATSKKAAGSSGTASGKKNSTRGTSDDGPATKRSKLFTLNNQLCTCDDDFVGTCEVHGKTGDGGTVQQQNEVPKDPHPQVPNHQQRESTKGPKQQKKVVNKGPKARIGVSNIPLEHLNGSTVEGKMSYREVKQVVTVYIEGERIVKPFSPGWQHKKVTELCSNLTAEQKKDVEDIGFGGLLLMKLKMPMPPGILPWLVMHFNFIFSKQEVGSNEYCITADDVYDVFCLPRNPTNAVGVKRNDNVALRDRYKASFGCQDKKDIKLKYLYDRMMILDKGGDEFKRLFVLYVSSYFLAPISAGKVDFKILEAVEDVENIKNLDWCTFVLNDLNAFIKRYMTVKDYTKCNACVPVLLFQFLHRFPVRGILDPLTLPFCMHWDDDNLREKVHILEAGGYDKGVMLKEGFPVCLGGRYRPSTAEAGPSRYPLLVRPIQESKYIEQDGVRQELKFPIPVGFRTDEMIKRASTNELHENLLIIRRNFKVVGADMARRLAKFQTVEQQSQQSDDGDAGEPQEHPQPQAEPQQQPRSTQPSSQPSEGSSQGGFWSDDLIAALDGSVKNYFKNLGNSFPSFKLLDSDDEYGPI